ncbi:helix-turn-helix transcriptional regulator [Streptomyces sp. NPDC005438]|uniref:helix-turn-helix domain-containing protein n=1 Tax=Streptomyces sp. NPDC005438 TaxID=3156880 RepID=UPI0033BD98BD
MAHCQAKDRLKGGKAVGEGRSAPTVSQLVLGLRLRDIRERAGRTFEDAAEALSVNTTTVRRMEKAEVGLKPLYVEKLLRLYGRPEDEVESFVSEVRASHQPGWWQRYRDVVPGWYALCVSLEQEAPLIRSYEPHHVPALLQTEEYARAQLAGHFPRADEEELERRLEFRRRRQEILDRPTPPRLWVVVEEHALARPVGGPQVMRAQIDWLRQRHAHPRFTLQVLPFSVGPHPGLGGSFQLFRFDHHELPDVVYVDGMRRAHYLNERTDTTAYLEALDRMSTLAWPAEQTDAVLRRVRAEL